MAIHLMIDTKKVVINDFEGIDRLDHPDYCDAYVVDADYDGEKMTEEEMDELMEEHPEFVYETLIEYLR
jgi:hypothetical protein